MNFNPNISPTFGKNKAPRKLLLGAYVVLKTLVAHGGFEPPISALRVGYLIAK